MSPFAPAPASPSSSLDRNFSVRRREVTDLTALRPLLAVVHAHDTYPVEGPSPPSSFLTPANELVSFVATRPVSPSIQDDAVGNRPIDQKGEEIIGHVLLSFLSPEINLHKAYTAHSAFQTPLSTSTEPGVASLGRLFTHPSYRGVGAGRALIDTALDWAREKGLKVLLNVMDKDVRAIELYGRLGWENIGRGVYRTEDGVEWGEVYFHAPP